MSLNLCCFLAACVYLNFRKSMPQYGIFNQLRVDCGEKFYLSLLIQEPLRDLRNDHTISPYGQTQSKNVSIFFCSNEKWDPFSILKRFIETLKPRNIDLIFKSVCFLPSKLRSKDLNDQRKSIWKTYLKRLFEY